MGLRLATGNAHKLREFGGLMEGVDFSGIPDSFVMPPETGTSFEENALIKARALAEATGEPAFADDSGICVEKLGGRPGVFSARWAGEEATDEENLALLLDQTDPGDRLEYVCVIAWVDPVAGEERTFEGRCIGSRAPEPRGEGGFGYDPAFVADEVPGRTMAELSAPEKDQISHRGRAARELRSWLEGR